jgi:acyl-CoA synthetase (AMP-forming)/AMP-acid ligase II
VEAVINLFGQTELAPVLSATRPADSRADQLTTVGRPLPQVDCKIVSPATGEVVPIEEEGEICARGYQQFIGYLPDAEATAATIDRDGFVHTGDLGSMDERGYLKVTGRLKELIIRGGENIAPVQVELVIAAYPLVETAVVVGLPDEQWGEVIACVLQLKCGSAGRPRGSAHRLRAGADVALQGAGPVVSRRRRPSAHTDREDPKIPGQGPDRESACPRSEGTDGFVGHLTARTPITAAFRGR